MITHEELRVKTLATPPDERLGFLMGLGFNHDQAADYMAFLEINIVEKGEM